MGAKHKHKYSAPAPKLTRLQSALALLAREVQAAQSRARDTNSTPNLSGVIRLLHQRPELQRYLEGVQRERGRLQEGGQELAVAQSRERLASSLAPAYLRDRPSGNNPQDEAAAAWGGAQKNFPQGVPNARVLRQIAETDVWVRAAIDDRCNDVCRSEIAVRPKDTRRAYSRDTMQRVQRLLDQPNEYRDSYRSLIQPVVEDVQTLDRGVIEKRMQLKPRVPARLYFQDGARLKIYPGWSGNPKEPRYLYESDAGDKRVPLLNDEAIVIIARPGTYRLGLAPVRTLYDVINADLKALASGSALVDHKPPPHLVQLVKASQRQIDRVRDTYDTEVSGRREILWLGGNEPAKVFPLIFSARDNQWMEWQLYLARQICAAFKISPQKLGITFDINKATAETQQSITEDTGLIPLLLLIEEYLNTELLYDFAPRLPDGRYDDDALNLEIVFPQVTEAQRKMHYLELATILEKGLPELPFLMPNDARQMLGLEPVPGGNRFWVMTTNGPMPWIGYEDAMGFYTAPGLGGQLGAQEPGSGPSANDLDDDDDAGADAPDDPDTAGSGDGGDAGGMDAGAPDLGSAGSQMGSDMAGPEGVGGDGLGGDGMVGTEAGTGDIGKALRKGQSGPHTGIMVAFFLDRTTANQLAIPGGELASELHLTLAYLGDKEDLEPGDISKLKKGLAAFAACMAPFSGEISGIGRFTSVPEGQPTVVYASVDAPKLPGWRQALVRHLAGMGFPADEQHGYTPHCTLAYLSADEPMPMEEVPALPVTFDRLWLAFGGARFSFPLQGNKLESRQLQQARAVPGSVPARGAVPAFDTRRPGRPWSPTPIALEKQKPPTPRGKVTTAQARHYQRPRAAEVQLTSAMQEAFEKARQRGVALKR